MQTRIARSLAALFLALLPSSPLRAAEDPARAAPRLAVFPLQCTGTDPTVGRSVVLALYTELPLYPEFVAVERERVETLIQEQKLGQTGLVDPSTAARVGRLLGASHALLGELLTTDGRTKLALRMCEVETARVVIAAEKAVPDPGQVDEVAAQALRDLMEGGPVYKASSVSSAQTRAQHAFDSNLATSWVAAPGNTSGWLEVWYQRPRTFGEASLVVKAGELGQGVPKRFTLSHWDGQKWTVIKEVMANTRAEWRERFSPITSTRWRFEVTAVIGGAGPVSVAELTLK